MKYLTTLGFPALAIACLALGLFVGVPEASAHGLTFDLSTMGVFGLAVVNTLGANITNANAVPRVLTENRVKGGVVHAQVDTVEVAAADDNTSTYRMARLHTSDVITHIWLYNDAITGGTDYDLGCYDVADNGGLVIDANNIATAVDMSSARTTLPLDLAHEALDIASCQQALWQVLGLATDPQKLVDLVLTANTVGSGAGTITLKVETLPGH